jgi:hypothetical protein
MKALQARKEMLVLESELNRAQLLRDLADLTAGVHAITARAKSLSSLGSSVAMLISALAVFRRGKPTEAGAKPSRLQTILTVAGLISTLWLAFRGQGHGQKR